MTRQGALNHYLLVLNREMDTTFVQDFGEDSDEALAHYAHHEYLGHECVLLGADSVETLRQTHGNWFLGITSLPRVRAAS